MDITDSIAIDLAISLLLISIDFYVQELRLLTESQQQKGNMT